MKEMLEYIQNEMMKYEVEKIDQQRKLENSKDKFLQQYYQENINYFNKQMHILAMMHSIIRVHKDNTEFYLELLKQNEKLKDIIALFVKKFDLSLNKNLKELHFDHTNYEWREINDGYSEEHYYQLTDKEYDLVEEVFEEDE